MNNTTNTTQSKNQPPVDHIQVGDVEASIWSNTSKTGSIYYSVTLQRKYKVGETLKASQAFYRSDLLQLAKVADLAFDRVRELEQQTPSAAA
jgi:hypothetical protein